MTTPSAMANGGNENRPTVTTPTRFGRHVATQVPSDESGAKRFTNLKRRNFLYAGWFFVI
jgi:hypothetical protein